MDRLKGECARNHSPDQIVVLLKNHSSAVTLQHIERRLEKSVNVAACIRRKRMMDPSSENYRLYAESCFNKLLLPMRKPIGPPTPVSDLCNGVLEAWVRFPIVCSDVRLVLPRRFHDDLTDSSMSTRVFECFVRIHFRERRTMKQHFDSTTQRPNR
jgi:hypothetical protein